MMMLSADILTAIMARNVFLRGERERVREKERESNKKKGEFKGKLYPQMFNVSVFEAPALS